MDKQYYKIGEVAKLLDIKSSVLRFWESEFPQLKPMKSSTGQRFYTARHIDIIKTIQKMLYVEKFTISGAKKILSDKETRAKAIDTIKDDEKMTEKVLKCQINMSKNELLSELNSIRETLLK